MILALIEHDRGKLNEASLEMLQLGRELAAELDMPLEAVLIGEEAQDLAEKMPAYGVSKVHLVRHERLHDYTAEAWGHSIVQLARSESAQVVLAAGTDRGNEVMAHVAARADLPLASNCTVIRAGDPYRVSRLRWGGSLLEEAYLDGGLKLITVAEHVIAMEEISNPAELEVNTFTPLLEDKDFRVRIIERETVGGDKISLADARVVVSGGRGVGSAEGFSVLEALAERLGGAVGASRVATNNGWRSHADQVGQTGARIAPDLYIACGISGAIQHLVGCKGSNRILVINTDREAPILSRADYAAIGDLHEILPAVIAELNKLP